MTFLETFILGIVEGITEYLPISSTGHLIITEHFLGIADDAGAKTFAIAIQLGAILAVLILYWKFLLQKLTSLSQKSSSQRFFVNLFLSFLPAAIIGLLFRKWIKAHLFSPYWVVAALLIGGILMIYLEKFLNSKRRRIKTIDDLTYLDSLLIGVAQCFSLWPGFSRSMATILGGRFTGLSAKDASEYSFFLALPTLGAATLYEMLQAFKEGGLQFDHSWWVSLLLGMFVSFVVAALVIKAFLAFLKKYPLAWFGYYRIALAIGLYFLLK